MPLRDALDPVDGVRGNDRYEIGGILCYSAFKTSGGEIKENRQHLQLSTPTHCSPEGRRKLIMVLGFYSGDLTS